MQGLEGRVALITGAGRGIGRAICVAYGQAGVKVAAAARSVDELDEVVSEINAAGGTAEAFVADLSDASVPGQIVAEVAGSLGPIEILVNNAGVGSSADPRPLKDFNDDFWDLTMQVNLNAPYRLTKLVLPPMIDAGFGRVITIASINSRQASLHGAAYAASKHGVLGLMRTAAVETARQGITVNCICPGPVRTLMNDIRIAYDADRLGKALDDHEPGLTPIGGRLEPEDIAPMAVYLASTAGRMITGQAFNVCGGVNMA
ncbi:MAG: SDR family NAD(P)-dependent oxidoreductase [Planctomycetaceae bacterium]|jgi:NAD(P)-dependent dehydrogenase (short-subunit alcohol dehydrogenase family)|nr:SDR family NAD(P)-dependent oxidoreductase [Planctomycetaceae bacterium]